LQPVPRFVVPGHGEPSADVADAMAVTRGYIEFVQREMRAAVADFMPFDEAYRAVDWSGYDNMPAFEASNRGNAYRIYLEMEAELFE
jgi:hypothetical protein